MTNERTSLEKYTSHTLFSKGVRKGWCWLCVRGELETEQTATYWPQVPLYYRSTSSSFCWAAQPGSCDCNSNWTLPASNTNWLKPSVAPGYIIVWHPPASCGRRICTELNHVHRSRWHCDIPDRMHLFLDWRLGRRSICYMIPFLLWMESNALEKSTNNDVASRFFYIYSFI